MCQRQNELYAVTLKCGRRKNLMGSEMPANNTELEKKLWDAADELRANSKLKSSEYSMDRVCS